MEEYTQLIVIIQLTKKRRKQQLSKCDISELYDFPNLTEKLNRSEHGVLSQAAFAANCVQQCYRKLTVGHVATANKVLLEVESIVPKAVMLHLSQNMDPCYFYFSDASHGSSSYGLTGYSSGLNVLAVGAGIFHAMDWSSLKQARIAFSSIAVEILAAVTPIDIVSPPAEQRKTTYKYSVSFLFVLLVYSNVLYSTIATLHEKHACRLWPTVSRKTDSFENGESSAMQWIPG